MAIQLKFGDKSGGNTFNITDSSKTYQPEQSKDIILKTRFTPIKTKEIKAVCYDKTREIGKEYTVSDFMRDASDLFSRYHDISQILMDPEIEKLIRPLLKRLSNK